MKNIEKKEYIMNYKGQEKVKISKGPFKGVFGYVRTTHLDGHLWVILDNGHKTSIRAEYVEFIHYNYFMIGFEKYKESFLQTHLTAH